MTSPLEKGLASSGKLLSTTSMYLHQTKQSEPSSFHHRGWIAHCPPAAGSVGFWAVFYTAKVSILENNKVKLLK